MIYKTTPTAARVATGYRTMRMRHTYACNTQRKGDGVRKVPVCLRFH